MILRILHHAAGWTRTQWLLLGALGALTLGAALPWYTLPQASLDAFNSSLWLPNLMRAIPVIGAVVIGCSFASSALMERQFVRLLFWAALSLCLLFPLLVATLCPAIAYLAAAFDQQRESVAYHIETHYPEIHVEWKQSIDIDPFAEVRPYAFDGLTRGYIDPLMTLPNAHPFVIDNAEFFQLSSWDRFIMEGLNYLPGFLAAAGWGWPVTVIGLIVCLIAVYLSTPAKVTVDLRAFRPCIVAGVIAVLLVIVGPCLVTRQISSWQAKGQHEIAAKAARVLYTIYPPIRGDTAFMLQLAECNLATGRKTPGLMSFAKGIECWRADQLDRSRSFFENALADSPHSYLIRGYLSANLLRLGAQQFEQEQPLAAADSFDLARRIFPNHLQAMYCQMIAQAAGADFEGSARTASEIRDLQHYFRQKSIAAMGQAHLHEAWADYRARRMPEAWQAYRQSVDPGIWE